MTGRIHQWFDDAAAAASHDDDDDDDDGNGVTIASIKDVDYKPKSITPVSP